MADGSLARRYARAVLSIARDQPNVVATTDAFASELAGFAEVLDLSNGELRGVLANPGITQGERRAVLDAVLPSMNLSPTVANLLRLLLDKGRFAVLPEIRVQYMAMADELAGRVRATVSTARALTLRSRPRSRLRWRRPPARPCWSPSRSTVPSSVAWLPRSATPSSTPVFAAA